MFSKEQDYWLPSDLFLVTERGLINGIFYVLTYYYINPITLKPAINDDSAVPFGCRVFQRDDFIVTGYSPLFLPIIKVPLPLKGH